MSSCFVGLHRAEQYSSLLRIRLLYRHIRVVSDLSLKTDSTQAINFREFSAMVLMFGDQLICGVTKTPRSLTDSHGWIVVPLGVRYS